MLILAVDDETLMLNMLVETLKNVFSDERYVVMGFDDGKEALEYVSSSEESLPYAFLDIRLRGMLGIELAKEIKEIRSETRIIFCSAYTEYALDAFSVHAVGYLLKPITKAKIQETLDQIDMMLNRDPEPERQKLVVQTFGHFEAFFNDKPLPWERAAKCPNDHLFSSENAETGRDGGCAGSRQKQNFDQCQKDQVRLVRLSGWRQFSHQRLPG